MRKYLLLVVLAMLALAGIARAEPSPPPEFRSGYTLPSEQQPLARALIWQYTDVAVLAAALGVAWYLVHRRRSRVGVFLLTVFSIAYFGFYRQGCVCAIGSIQNVAAAAFNSSYSLPWTVAAFFGLPLIVALFAGRVFCSGVCPLGAIQDVFLFRPIQVPSWVEASLGLFAHLYLGLAVVFAATGSDFVICSYDPFVGFYRLSGSVGMLLTGGALLVLSMFVGRAYCRFICPYSVLLRLVSPLAQWKVHVSPAECIDCRLCEKSCPFGALKRPVRQSVARDKARRRLAYAVLGALVLLVILPVLGYASRPVLAKMDRTVQLAHRVFAEESGTVKGHTDDTTAWLKTGEPAPDLYRRAAAIEFRLGIGGIALGIWMALAISGRGLRWITPGRGAIYDADDAGCVACARCFESCPIELQRRGIPLTLTLEGAPLPATPAEVTT